MDHGLCITSAKPTHSLLDRIDLARRTATAVAFTHAVDWVHKSVRPENIIVVAGERIPKTKLAFSLGDVYVLGFERSRTGQGDSNFVESEDWESKIYRHLERHTAAGNKRFAPYHEMYSLGVVLIEIAAWTLMRCVEKSDARGRGIPIFKDLQEDTGGITKEIPSRAKRMDRYLSTTYLGSSSDVWRLT